MPHDSLCMVYVMPVWWGSRVPLPIVAKSASLLLQAMVLGQSIAYCMIPLEDGVHGGGMPRSGMGTYVSLFAHWQAVTCVLWQALPIAYWVWCLVLVWAAPSICAHWWTSCHAHWQVAPTDPARGWTCAITSGVWAVNGISACKQTLNHIFQCFQIVLHCRWLWKHLLCFPSQTMNSKHWRAASQVSGQYARELWGVFHLMWCLFWAVPWRCLLRSRVLQLRSPVFLMNSSHSLALPGAPITDNVLGAQPRVFHHATIPYKPHGTGLTTYVLVSYIHNRATTYKSYLPSKTGLPM